MSKTIIYTGIINSMDFGVNENYDFLKDPLVIDDDCDYVCLTNNPNLTSKVWNIVQVPLKFDGCATRTQREFKILTHEYFPEYERSLYIDGTLRIKKNVNKFIDRGLEESSLVIRTHPKRNCIYKEAKHLNKIHATNPKDSPERVAAHVEKYKLREFPSSHGLWATNVIIRNHNDPKIIECMEAWWKEYLSGSKRDQLALPYSFWKNDFKPARITETQFTDYFMKKQHRIKHGKIRTGPRYE
tara:strand:+ start:1270 stop:1995 length:726 start_codon:yes stop_codon:yes gene_type:complete